MVQSWIRDVTTYQNVFADQQIMHFYRSEKILLHGLGLYWANFLYVVTLTLLHLD